MPYVPTASDEFFARSIVSLIKDGGLWALPASAMSFRVYHGAGGDGPRLVLQPGPCDDELFERSRAVFGRVGYSVVKCSPAGQG